MFDVGAPIWRFLKVLGAKQDPELSRTAESGLFIVEVFPALALPAFDVKFNGRCKAPKYNPATRSFKPRTQHSRILGIICLAFTKRTADFSDHPLPSAQRCRRRPGRSISHLGRSDANSQRFAEFRAILQ
jgi:predicted RNase H-like nuclease